jgi:hypothetical protein
MFTLHRAVLTVTTSVPELSALLSVNRQMYLAIHDPPILRAEDLKIHGWRIAAELLSGTFGPERCQPARTISRHVSRVSQKVD